MYHTALKNGLTYEGISGTNKASGPWGEAMANDLVISGLPEAFDKCDCLYAEAPYPDGFSKFNARAGVDDGRGYNDLAKAIAGVIGASKIPVFILSGQRLIKQLPAPTGSGLVNLRSGKANMAWWGYDYDGEYRRTHDLMALLAKDFNCLGDFCCGYGEPLEAFIRAGGKQVVAADYNAKCITIVSKRLGRLYD